MGGFRAGVILLLFLYGTISLGIIPGSGRAIACPLYCLDVDYMTCQSSGDKKLSPGATAAWLPRTAPFTFLMVLHFIVSLDES
ncbi:hypothetical protein GH714_021895 [Hevea brasiliensis]|uniref:Uncharacterized protein n=1 Tax=Hevea brasiliensis TaxID=3981 RepID=A0A6A6L7G5_HEVBR|nr:hypothetical protein GH714_021895 [Hevea brasiliensis]